MRRSTVVSLLAVALLGAAWWFFAPVQLGGQARYVVTHGISMEPGFHTGDLAVLRPASQYRVGEVAGYHSRLLDTTVMHRIVARSGDRYVFRGDNNSWRDPEHPASARLLGRLFVRIPRGGVLLAWVHRPAHAAALAVLLALATGTSEQSRRRRRRRARAERRPMPSPMHPRLYRRSLAAGVAALVLLGATTVAAFLSATTAARPHTASWTEQVQYGYSATVAPSPVYPTGRVRSGDTVYRQLVHDLAVTAQWSLVSSLPHHVRGTLALRGVVHGDSGWTHAFALAPPRPLSATASSTTGRLDLVALGHLADRIGTLTGVPVGGYTISITPVLRLHGTVAGRPVAAQTPGTALAPLVFTATPSTLTAAGSPSTAANGGGPTTGTPRAALAPVSSSHQVTVPGTGPARWDLRFWQPQVNTMRAIGPAGTAAAAIAVLALLLTGSRAGRRRKHTSEAGDLPPGLRRLMVTIDHLESSALRAVVDVPTLAELGKVAQRYDRLILRTPRHGGAEETFYVEDEGTLYRHTPHGLRSARTHAAGVAGRTARPRVVPSGHAARAGNAQVGGK